MEMMAELEPRFEPHPIIFEFLDIIQSVRAAPGVPRFLHRAIARASVSLLPDHIRRKLDLGSRYDLTRLDRIALRIAGRSEEHTSELQSLTRISYAVFCLKKKNTAKPHKDINLLTAKCYTHARNIH